MVGACSGRGRDLLRGIEVLLGDGRGRLAAADVEALGSASFCRDAVFRATSADLAIAAPSICFGGLYRLHMADVGFKGFTARYRAYLTFYPDDFCQRWRKAIEGIPGVDAKHASGRICVLLHIDTRSRVTGRIPLHWDLGQGLLMFFSVQLIVIQSRCRKSTCSFTSDSPI